MSVTKVSAAFLIFFVSGIMVQGAAAQSDNDTVWTAVEVSTAGLELARDSLESGNAESARAYSDFTANYFAKQVNDLREATGSGSVDEIHITLLDISAKIGRSDALPDIERAMGLLRGLPHDAEALPDLVIVSLLSMSDEQYQIGTLEENEPAYQISRKLIQRSVDLFEYTNFDERLTLEVQSFFVDLDEQTANREEFTRVGSLITIIQRDVLGTESVVFDQQELYGTIRVLYDEMLVLVDAGDYVNAEEKAIIAYLDNFEYLEPAIDKVDKELLYVLEINMRENLRDMIRDGEPAPDIRAYVNDVIMPDLDLAESLVMNEIQVNPTFLNPASAASAENLRQMGDSTEEEKTGVRAEVDYIRNSLLDVTTLYADGDYESAYATARSAYLDSYEFVEIPLREIAPDFTLEVEYQFAELRNMIKERDDPEKIREIVIAINRNLDESERLVSGTGTLAPSIAFISSFAIIFREGLESVLILGAILTYLEASRNARLKKYVYYGVVAAVAATVATWIVASYVIEISGANRELIEAIAALSATAVLFYVSFWVLNKIEHRKWMEFVKAKVWQATTTGSVMVFVMLAFFTVYREGFETVLFYQAMMGFAKYMEGYVGLGFVIGMASLFVIYYVMRRLGRRLPLRALFGLTMGVGAYLSIAFLGNAIRELQILDILPYTSMIGTVPRFDINIATMTGIYPTLETVVGQIVLLAIYLGAASYVLILRPKRERQLAMMRKSRKSEDAGA